MLLESPNKMHSRWSIVAISYGFGGYRLPVEKWSAKTTALGVALSCNCLHLYKHTENRRPECDLTQSVVEPKK